MNKKSFIDIAKKVRRLRHKKLFAKQAFWYKGLCFCKNIFRKKSEHILQDHMSVFEAEQNPAEVYAQFYGKSISFVLGIFLISSIVPAYAEMQDEYVLLEESGDYDIENALGFEDTITSIAEDGFIVYSAGQTEVGDRSNMNAPIVYEVKSGDSLSRIAQKFHISIQTIVWNNDELNTNRLRVGTKLTILPVDGILHMVEEKDTLEKIASKYKVKKEDIEKQNKLEKLVKGTQIIIPGANYVPPQITANNPINYGIPPKNVTTQKYIQGSNKPYSGNNFQSGVVRLIKPTTGSYTQGYHKGHYAVDIANSNEGPIYASASGKVIKASYGWNGGCGNMVVIDHGDGVKTLYGHNEVLYVKVGDIVSQGETIAWMGNSGRTYGRTGIHLHFEVIINGVKKNPLAYY